MDPYLMTKGYHRFQNLFASDQGLLFPITLANFFVCVRVGVGGGLISIKYLVVGHPVQYDFYHIRLLVWNLVLNLV